MGCAPPTPCWCPVQCEYYALEGLSDLLYTVRLAKQRLNPALEMEGVTEEGEKVVFSEEAWKKAYQQMEDMFPKRTVQGWFLCGVPGCLLSPLDYWKQHSQYFSGKHKLMYLNRRAGRRGGTLHNLQRRLL